MPGEISPYSYLQEELRHDPWKMLVACIMLNLTNYRQVRQVIWTFFDRWPNAESLSRADQNQVADHIRSLGLYNRRAKTLIQMSLGVTQSESWMDDPGSLHGVGKYALDSWKIFILQQPEIDGVTDKELLRYQEWWRNRR